MHVNSVLSLPVQVKVNGPAVVVVELPGAIVVPVVVLVVVAVGVMSHVSTLAQPILKVKYYPPQPGPSSSVLATLTLGPDLVPFLTNAWGVSEVGDAAADSSVVGSLGQAVSALPELSTTSRWRVK